MQKKLKGVFAKVNTGLKKSILINATIFALCIFPSKHPLVAKMWRQSLKNMIFALFPVPHYNFPIVQWLMVVGGVFQWS